MRIELHTADASLAERACAEAYARGALGLEERGEPARSWHIYAPASRAGAVVRALAAVVGTAGRVSAPLAVGPENWAERWKEFLHPVDVSPRLRVRPSFRPPESRAGRAEVVIEPGQAFGTGAHVSTRLALAWLDALRHELGPASRVLDVGTGSGVLALAALRLGPGRALGLDLDPLAARAARDNALRNGLERRLDVLAGPLAALRAEPFDLVLANLLSGELRSVAAQIAARARDGAAVIVSGLLASERETVTAWLRRVGLAAEGERRAADADGVLWVALLTRRAAPRASLRGADPG